MKNSKFVLLCLISISLVLSTFPSSGWALKKTRPPSNVLLNNAWKALEEKDLDQVLYFTNKCLELYGQQARRYQSILKEYPSGKKEDILFYWPLNDVGTALYVKAEGYRKAGYVHRATAVYNEIIDNYSYSQCWIPSGGFWKPSEEAKSKIAILTGRSDIIVDKTSKGLTAKAWNALGHNQYEDALFFVNTCLKLYEKKAKQLQKSMLNFSKVGKLSLQDTQTIHDVATCLYIKAHVYKSLRRPSQARSIVQRLLKEFPKAYYQNPYGQYQPLSDIAKNLL